MPERRRLSTATLILGVPGAGKTSLLATLAIYVWETFHKVTLFYSWDGGAIPTELQRLMHFGIIRFWRCRTRSGEGLGIEGTMLATKGYWAAHIDPETGETDPGVRLVPPLTGVYTVRCQKSGELLATLPAMSTTIVPTFCTPCKTLHTKAELDVTGDVRRTRGFEDVGAVCYDGLTSIGFVVVDHMDQQRGAGQIGGEKSAFGGVVTSGDLKYGGTNRADIGFAQTRCREAVHNSLSIPGLVASPVFTALSFEATDEGGLPIVGAKLPGRAATDEASAWFGNVFEMGRTADDAGLEHFTLFLKPFTDAQGRRHLLKTSGSPTGLPDKLIDPIDAPWSQANLGLVFKLLDDDLTRALAIPIAGAPGLSNVPHDYGETFQVTPAAQAPAPAPALTLTPPAPTQAAAPPVVAGPAPAAAGPPVVAGRKRPQRPVDVPLPLGEPTPAPEPAQAVGSNVVPPLPAQPAPAPVASSSAPPPPPGMKPPARAPQAPEPSAVTPS